MAGPRTRIEMNTEFPEPSPRSGFEVSMAEASRATTPEESLESVDSINKKIAEDVASKIKSKFLPVTGVHGRNQLLDTATHSPGVDYTAGGRLYVRWVTNDESNISQKRLKGFRLPAEISSAMKNLTIGNMILMVRPIEVQAAHAQNVEQLNKKWEASNKPNYSSKPTTGTGIGEFEVTPQRAVRG